MTTQPFTSTYRPVFTRSVVVEGDLTDLLTEEVCGLWAGRSWVSGVVSVNETRRVTLRVEYPVEGETPTLCFPYSVVLVDEDGDLAAHLGAVRDSAPQYGEWGTGLTGLYHAAHSQIQSEEWGYLPVLIDPRVAARDVGGPTTTGEVNGRDPIVAALEKGLLKVLPASIVRQLVDPDELGSWVSECLARTWAWLDGRGAFDAPAEVLTPAWEQAAGEIAACFRQDSCGWLFQSLQGWNSYLVRQIWQLWMWEQRPGLDLARRALIRVLAPLAKPYGVTLGEDGDFLIRDDADENTAREVCQKALTTDVVVSALDNARHANTPALDALYSLPAPQEATSGGALPPVEVAEYQDVREILDGMELLPGENRRFAAVWRSITARHGENVYLRGVAPIAGSDDWLVWWSSNGGYSSDRQWVVEFRLSPLLCEEPKLLAPRSMRILTTSRDGSGQHLQPEIVTCCTPLVAQAFRRRLITNGRYQLALDAFIEGRKDEVWDGLNGEPHIDCTYEEALTRGLELLRTLTPAQPVDECRIPVQHPEPTNNSDDDYEADEDYEDEEE